MLDRLYAVLPKEALSRERFELLEPDSLIQGKKTVLRNFSAIAKQLNRKEEHLIKFFTKEFAVPIVKEEERLVLNGKFSQEQLKKAISNYAKQFVLCSECNRPDTKFEEKEGVKILKCTACGAINPMKKL